jgi:predicted secreted protein
MIRRSAFAGAGLAAVALMCAAPSPAQEPRAEYRMSLTDVYGAYQSILARREACASAFPQTRPASDKAYTAWQNRHRKLLDELDQRINMMIRGASKDEKDYTKNIGKYEGAILRQREEVKQSLLQQPRAEFEPECKALADFLQSAESDLEKGFAEQLAILRKRPLAKR